MTKIHKYRVVYRSASGQVGQQIVRARGLRGIQLRLWMMTKAYVRRVDGRKTYRLIAAPNNRGQKLVPFHKE